MTVVLVLANTDAAFYQREEIAAAIDLARRSEAGHRVVPVCLDLHSGDVPYGLRLKHGLAVSDQVPIQQVAARLLDLHRTIAAQAAGPGRIRCHASTHTGLVTHGTHCPVVRPRPCGESAGSRRPHRARPVHRPGRRRQALPAELGHVIVSGRCSAGFPRSRRG